MTEWKYRRFRGTDLRETCYKHDWRVITMIMGISRLKCDACNEVKEI